MNVLTVWDHLLFVFIFLAYPTYARLTFSKSIAVIMAGGSRAKIKAYQSTIGTWLVFAVVLMLLWLLLGRSWSPLGFNAGEWLQQAIALLAAVAVIALFVVPLRKQALAGSETGEGVTANLGDFVHLLPANSAELRWFNVVSVNAGVTEELLFRGYLFWYLGHFMPLHWAAVTSTVLFTLAHAYQGLKQLPGIAFVAAVCAGLYLYTGSLLVPVLFHVLLDAVQGHYLARILRV